MTGGEAVVRSLLSHGVEVIFGLPGVQNDWFYNALFDQRDRVRLIHTRHEQGAGYMALGYALALGDVGTYNVVPGPGVLNSSAALATAYALNARVLLVAGQVPSHQIGRGIGVLHETPDQLGLLRSLTKWAGRILSAGEAASLVDRAFSELWSGRPQPVALEIPMDVLAKRGVVSDGPGDASHFAPPVDEDLLGEAAKLLAAARCPMIFVGSGALEAAADVRELAETLQAPVVSYRTGRGIVDSRHYLSFVQPAAKPLWDYADVVLALGTNMRTPLTTWPVNRDRKLIRIDVDPSAHDRLAAPDIAITARVEDALPRLLIDVAALSHRRTSRKDELDAVQAKWKARSAVLEPQISYLKVIREALGEDGVFVDEVTQVGFASRLVMPVYHPRTFISTGYMGTLGYGFPTALGVKVALPDRPVISISGDGGFMFGVGELATAVQHRIGLVTIVFNNNQYGNVQQMQRHRYGDRVIASDLKNPDFVKLAESFGLEGFRASSPRELLTVLQTACARSDPTLIEVPVGDMPSVDEFR